LADDHEINFDQMACYVEGLSKQRKKAGFKREKIAIGLFGVAVVTLGLGAWAPWEDGPAPPKKVAQGIIEKTPAEIVLKEIREAFRMSRLNLDVALASDKSEIFIGRDGQPLKTQEKVRLTNILDAFSRRSAVPLTDMTRLSSGLDSFVVAVALEPVRFVVGVDGQRYREGDLIMEGWRVENITRGYVTVSRGGEQDMLAMNTTNKPLVLRLAQNTGGLAR
jgi:hypothetical protein